MRQTLSRGMLAAAAATSILSLYGSPALAGPDPTGTAADAPGVVSGSAAQTPASTPADDCANSAGTAALHPAAGNSCATDSGHGAPGYGSEDTSGTKTGTTPPPDTHETPTAGGDDASPGYGDDASPGYGDDASPAYGGETSPPPTSPPPTMRPPTSPPPATRPPTSPPPSRTAPPHGGQHHGAPPTLPHTGSEAMLAASAVSAALVAGGAMLYRRGRAASRRP